MDRIKHACGLLVAGLVLVAGADRAAAQDCQDDSECGQYEVCDIYGVSGSTCAPGEQCLPPEEFGECTPASMLCRRDGDCPAGLVCAIDPDDAPCAISSDGMVDCPEPALASEGECAYRPTACETDAQCAAGEQCVVAGTEEKCSGRACAPDEECDFEELCELVSQLRFCFPAFIPCEVPEQCPTGSDCLRFGEASDGEPPPFWDVRDATGACLPEGLAMAARGDADVDLDFDGDGRNSDPEASLDGTAAGGPANSAGNTAGTSEGGNGSGLCSIGTGRSPAPAAFLMTLPLALLLRRRRR